jgi:hypothetical protein
VTLTSIVVEVAALPLDPLNFHKTLQVPAVKVLTVALVKMPAVLSHVVTPVTEQTVGVRVETSNK